MSGTPDDEKNTELAHSMMVHFCGALMKVPQIQVDNMLAAMLSIVINTYLQFASVGDVQAMLRRVADQLPDAIAAAGGASVDLSSMVPAGKA
jgi:hypothetical protein